MSSMPSGINNAPRLGVAAASTKKENQFGGQWSLSGSGGLLARGGGGGPLLATQQQQRRMPPPGGCGNPMPLYVGGSGGIGGGGANGKTGSSGMGDGAPFVLTPKSYNRSPNPYRSSSHRPEGTTRVGLAASCSTARTTTTATHHAGGISPTVLHRSPTSGFGRFKFRDPSVLERR